MWIHPVQNKLTRCFQTLKTAIRARKNMPPVTMQIPAASAASVPTYRDISIEIYY